MYTEKNSYPESSSTNNNNSEKSFNRQNSFEAPMVISSSSRNPFTENLPKEPELTELGQVLAHLPLEPQLARLLLFGVALKCLNPIVTLVAAISHRDPCE